MKKRMLAITMILALVLTSTAYAFADVQTRDTNVVIFNVTRDSRTTASATVNVTFSNTVDRYNVVIYLQKNVDGEWKLATENEDYVIYNNGWNDLGFTFNHIYTNLTSGTIYRLKCVSKDYIGDLVYNTTTYSNQF